MKFSWCDSSCWSWRYSSYFIHIIILALLVFPFLRLQPEIFRINFCSLLMSFWGSHVLSGSSTYLNLENVITWGLWKSFSCLHRLPEEYCWFYTIFQCKMGMMEIRERSKEELLILYYYTSIIDWINGTLASPLAIGSQQILQHFHSPYSQRVTLILNKAHFGFGVMYLPVPQ